MEKIKHTVTTRWKLLLVICLLLPGVLALLVTYPPVNAEGKVDSTSVAAWVQGVGTLLAVLAAAWIARDQFDWQQLAEARRAKESQLQELKVIRDILAELVDIVRPAHVAASGSDTEYVNFYRQGGNLDFIAFSALLDLLGWAPLSPHHGPAMFISAQKARSAAHSVRSLMELFKRYADGVPVQPRELSWVSELAKHRDVLMEMSLSFDEAVKAAQVK